MQIEYFKSKFSTIRFNKNQKVWIRFNHPNHLDIFFKWRGNGRYVSGMCDKYAPYVGEIKKIEVDEPFAKRIKGGE